MLTSESKAGKWYNRVLLNISNKITNYLYSKSQLFNKPIIIPIHESKTGTKNIAKNTLLGLSFYSMLNIERSYSTLSSSVVVPVKIYSNADLDKSQMLKDNKGKSGVYR